MINLRLKMKSYLVVLLIFVSTNTVVFAQNQPLDSEALNKQISNLYQLGNFNEAIPLAEQVLDNEKRISKDSETYAIALMNLGMLHKERLRLLLRLNAAGKVADGKNDPKTIETDSEKSESLFRKSLTVYNKLGQGESISTSALKNELAWVLNNHMPVSPRLDPRSRIDEAEKLFTEALAVQEKFSGSESDATMKSVLGFGDFYMRWINFEKALPFYERYISTTEKKHGTSHKALVPAFRGMVELLIITDRETEAANLAKRISTITGKSELLPVTSPRLALRARQIERIKLKRFAPPAAFDNPAFLFSYAYGFGSISMMGTVRVRQTAVNILVDEKGDVIEAKAVDPQFKDASEIEAAAFKSKFRPYNYKGVAQKMRGTLTYPYFEN